MKVLFAVSNEEVSEAIVKRYQKNYKEIISYKNVYYFNAILKELQKDKNYDRIVISEELEAFTNTQYSQIDKFIFDKLDSISDEASNLKGDDIPIILICSDRREKSEEMLVKLFGIGIYNALIGNDRSVDNVCQLLNKPRLKKEAKTYYKIDSDDVSYQAESENDVSEVEIQNILAHYKRLGKDEKKYVESFDNIASQYNDIQLRIISKFLPLNVRAVLEEKSPKYQEIISFNSKISDNLRAQSVKKEQKEGTSEKLLNMGNNEKILSKPVVIPSSVNMSSTKKLAKVKNVVKPIENVQGKTVTDVRKVGPKFEENMNTKVAGPMFEENTYNEIDKLLNDQINNQISNQAQGINQMQNSEIPEVQEKEEKMKESTSIEPPKRGRGRPRKNPVPVQNENSAPKRGRGRPRKNPVIEDQENIVLPGIENKEEKEDAILPGVEEKTQVEDTILPGFGDQQEESTVLPGFEEDTSNVNENVLPGFDENNEQQEQPSYQQINQENNAQNNQMYSNMNYSNELNYGNNYNSFNRQETRLQNVNETYENVDISRLLTSDKKVACFIGTSKNGTSFIVNNVADITSKMGIDTAILDTTKNRNSYYIYTKNDEELRKVAMNSISNLLQDNANGIQVNKNLTVYTSLPDETEGIENAGTILQTLLKKHSLVLIDCDFDTPIQYFEKTQEIYLVQTFDILTIQPLTAFLRELKSRNVLDQNKLRVVLNKALKLRGVNDKTIIGGMAYYNDPAMSFMTELFDKNTVRYIAVPFNEEVYTKYLENIIECEVSTKGYPKNILQILNELANMVYPVVSGKSTYVPPTVERNSVFSPSMNSTLNQMKNRY